MTQVDAPPPVDAGEAPPGPDRQRRFGRRSTLVRDVLEVLLLAVVLYFVITFALQTVRVDGTSMVPTLQSGDLLFADKLSYHLHSPNRGDIVILEPPGDPSKDFIKRVIGIPGDVLEIRSDYTGGGSRPHAAVLIKPGGQGAWQVLDEPYLPDQSRDPWVESASCCTADGHYSAEPTPMTIPADQFFVLGDNRNGSKDSRAIGLIPKDKILGRAWVRIYPFGRFGFLGDGPALRAAAVLPLPLLRLGARRRRRRRGAIARAA